jgi:hypothetical protein
MGQKDLAVLLEEQNVLQGELKGMTHTCFGEQGEEG